MTASPQGSPRLPVELALLGLLALLWGSSYLFGRIAVLEIPPLTLVATRVSIAAIFLLALTTWNGDRLPRDAHDWGKLFVQALFNSILAWTILAWGQRQIDSGLAAVLNSTAPIFVFFITALVTRHEQTTAAKLAGACLGLGGVILIVGVDAMRGLGLQVAGQLAALFGAFLYGCAAIYGKRLAHLPAAVTAAGTMLCASLTLWPAALVIDRPWTLSPSPRALLSALALGIFCTGIALALYFRLLRTLGSLGVASQAYLRAGVGVLLGMFVLGESLTPTVFAGLAAAVAGVALINLPARRKPAS